MSTGRDGRPKTERMEGIKGEDGRDDNFFKSLNETKKMMER